MSGVELGLGILGAIDVCYRYGKALARTCDVFRAADSRLNEASLRIEACWMRIELQLQVVRGLESVLDERHRDIQQRMLGVLMLKLQAADSTLVSLVKTLPSARDPANPHKERFGAKKLRYSLLEDDLAAVISELEVWQRMYDLPWYLIMSIAKPEVDDQLEITSAEQRGVNNNSPSVTSIATAKYIRRALKENGNAPASTIFLAPDGLIRESVQPVPFSLVSTARRAGNNELVLLDPVAFSSKPNPNNVLRDVRDFAQALRHADPFTFGLLECKGVLKGDATNSNKKAADESQPFQITTELSFVFRIPPSQQDVSSLRGSLINRATTDNVSLSERFELARQLVHAVNYVHIYGYVHKNVRPETILLLVTGTAGSGVGQRKEELGNAAKQAILVGFDTLRDAGGNTRRVGDDDWTRNLYRHPNRQGRNLEVDYEMRHDIYSVGVCLLEIGLWESFVLYNASEPPSQIHDDGIAIPANAATLADMTKARLGQQLESLGNPAQLAKSPDRVKEYMLKLARSTLRRRMGTRYSKVVETCLTCLDADNQDFGNELEFQDEDGIAVGVRYIEKVAAKLSEIVI